jgi:DNA-binding GntR family transcriptional regulator
MASRYPEIQKDILKKIEENTYQPGELLPTEKEFTEHFQVSRMTVRRAFDELIQDGVLIRRPGSGVYVAKKKIERSEKKLSVSHDEDIQQLFQELSVEVLEFSVVTNHPVVKQFLQLEDEEVYQVKRLQLGDQQPIVYENLFLPKRYFKEITATDFKQSMQAIVDQFMVKKTVALQDEITVEARPATTQLATFLQVPVNASLLQIDIVKMAEDGSRLFCGINSYAGDQFSYRV